MLQSRRSAGLLAMTILLANALPIVAKDAQWENHISAGVKAESEGNYAQAQDEFAEALKLTAKFQANDPRLAKTYYESGELRLKQEDWSTAQQYFERALKVQEKLGDPESLEMGNILSGLATAHEQLGNHQMAVLLLKRVRKIWTKHYGANDDRLTSILPSMATYAMLDSDYATAQDCYRQLVGIEEHNGANSSRLGAALNSQASCLAYIGKFAEAEPIAQRAVTILNSAGDSPNTMDSANANLQYICQKLGKAAPASTDKPMPAAPAIAKTPEPAVSKAPVIAPVVAKTPATPTKTITPTKPAADSEPEIATAPATVPSLTSTTVTGQLLAKPNVQASSTTINKEPIKNQIATKAPEIIKPWESKEKGSPAPSTTTSNPNPGKIQYLAGGRLISPEQFKAMTLANNAYELIREQKYTMAIDILKNALGIYPELASAHSNLGLAYSQMGQYNDAETQLRKAISIDASRPSAWLNLASTFQVGGQLKEAAATYAEFMQRFPAQKLVAKVQQIRSQLDKELQEQAAVEQTGTPSTADYFTYASHDGSAHWNKGAIKVYVASGTGTPGYKDEYAGFLADSFKQWETACPQLKFQVVKAQAGSDIECAWTDDAAKMTSPLEGGDTNVQRNGSSINHATITILTKNPAGDAPLSQNQLRVICLHQIGHALGLTGHSPKPLDVMFCSLPAASVKLPLSQRDTATIQKLYTNVSLLRFSQVISYAQDTLRW